MVAFFGASLPDEYDEYMKKLADRGGGGLWKPFLNCEGPHKDFNEDFNKDF